MSKIRTLVENYLYEFRQMGQWIDSTEDDAGIFLITELAELIKELAESKIGGQEYVRNNSVEALSYGNELNIRYEIGGVLLMMDIYIRFWGYSLEEVLEEYLKYMLEKRIEKLEILSR